MKLIDMNQMIRQELRKKAYYVREYLSPYAKDAGYGKAVYQYDPTTKEEYIFVLDWLSKFRWAVCVTASSLTVYNHDGGDKDFFEALNDVDNRRIYKCPIKDKVATACSYVDTHWCNNVRCKRCGHLVLSSDAEGYKFQCLHHGKDLVGFEAVENQDVNPTQEEYDELVKLVISEIL